MNDLNNRDHCDDTMNFCFSAQCVKIESTDIGYVDVTFYTEPDNEFIISMTVAAAEASFKVHHQYDFDVRHLIEQEFIEPRGLEL